MRNLQNALNISYLTFPINCNNRHCLNLKGNILYTIAYIISGLFMISGLVFSLRSIIMRSTGPLALGLPSFFFGTAIYLLIQIALK